MKQIKQILQEEINYHNKEFGKHKELAQKTGSKNQKQKALKHYHKRFQTVKIARELGFNFCSCCGNLK